MPTHNPHVLATTPDPLAKAHPPTHPPTPHFYQPNPNQAPTSQSALYHKIPHTHHPPATVPALPAPPRAKGPAAAGAWCAWPGR
eukprot:scaffold184849_cov18-Tisochrysis_lutea.AAC.3